MDIFMMIRRQKLTLFVDAKESSTVLELKKIIEGITKVSPDNIRLIVDSTKQPMDVDTQTLADYGLSNVAAKAYSPVLLYLCYRKNTSGHDNDWEPVDVAEL
jgi:transcription elongation factor B subunit 2